MGRDNFTRFKVRYHDSPSAGRLALLTMDNQSSGPNTFEERALRSLHEALDDIDAQEDVRGLLLTGKPWVFCAGADVSRFRGATPDDARKGCRLGHEAFQRLRDLPFPTLAAINGVCMGGGLEIALHCDYRTASAAARPIAFPEVYLGIVPAWGGTQLTPRLVGAETALQLIIRNALDNNRTIDAQKAADIGLIDRLFQPVDLLSDSLQLLEAVISGEEKIDRPQPDHGDLEELLSETRDWVDGKVHGATPAPYQALDLIEFAARDGEFEEGLEREESAVVELMPARQAQAGFYSFQLTQRRVKKQPWRPEAPPHDIKKVGICGSGLMGSQLGSLLLRKLEVPLVMQDINEEVLEKARERIEGSIDDQVGKGRIKESKGRFLKSVVTYTTDYEPFEASDLVLEAVLEELDLKKQIFGELEEVIGPKAILATNTSSLSVTAMAEELQQPERVVGLHFFNPVNVMPLVEIVKTTHASDEALSTAFEIVDDLGKRPLLCKDTPAFIVNRVLMRFLVAAIQTARRGNDFAEIDAAIKELGMPMGPFELLGFVGLPVALHTVKTLHEAYPERFPVPENLQRIAELDVDGFYADGREPHDEISEAWEVDQDAAKLDHDDIRRKALEAVADEAKIMLEEEVVADARDIDTGMLLGANWPVFMGGICLYLDQVGISEELFGEPLVGEEDQAFS